MMVLLGIALAATVVSVQSIVLKRREHLAIAAETPFLIAFHLV